jgi:hypothetical protein
METFRQSGVSKRNEPGCFEVLEWMKQTDSEFWVDETYGLNKEIHVNPEDISQNSGSDAMRELIALF